MVEANENPQLVTMKRQHDLEESQQAYKDWLVAQASSVEHQTQSILVVESAQAQQPQPPPFSPEEDYATFRHVRLAVVGVLVVILIVIWFRQKKSLS